MCGIISVIGTPVENKIVDGLYNLQNRGYDSVGIMSIDSTTSLFKHDKYVSDSNGFAMDKLILDKGRYKCDTIGMGHTRWATHGSKTIENSHPHFSYDNKFAIVHNGIIENFEEIRNFLENKNINSRSSTDTEVVVNLLAYIYNKNYSAKTTTTDRVYNSITETLSMITGTWGLVIMFIDTPNKLWCTRKGSPILIHHSRELAIITSETSGFNGFCSDYIILENDDICEITKTDIINVKCHHNIYEKVQNKDLIITYSPQPFPHWMLKEIHEQPESSSRTINLGGRLVGSNVKLGGLDENSSILKKTDNIIILGCGTSYYAGLLGVQYFKKICKFNTVMIFDGAEFDISDVPKIGITTIILLSQSGETKDLHRCLDVANKNNIFTVGVVNVPDSLIAREVNCGCYINAGREVSVASTKSFTSQAITLAMIAIWFAGIFDIFVSEKYIHSLRNLPTDIQSVITDSTAVVDQYLKLFENKNSCFILGKGEMEPIAHEGALKLKEVSYIHAEGYSASSLKHGPFALLDESFPVILLGIEGETYSKIMNCYEEISSRGAEILLITNINSNKKNQIIINPKSKFIDILSIIPLQLLAYGLAIKRGINPDKPRNLAKVVTVE